MKIKFNAPSVTINPKAQSVSINTGAPIARDVISPYIKIEEVEDGAIITCTDPNGTTSAEIYNGTDGVDGVSPDVSVSTITGGHEVTITDADGDHTFDVMDGVDGRDGATGRTPEIFTRAVGLAAGSAPYADTTGTVEQPLITFGIPSGAAGQDGKDGKDGTDGTDGVSPEVTIASITGGHSVTITDADHPTGQTFNVMDGAQGNPTTVNGKTGASITLTASDVGALPDTYTAPVTSVNSKTGAVTLSASDVGALPDTYSAPVSSVNGETGAVSLDAADVGALPDDTLYAASHTAGGAAERAVSIPYGEVDSTSTNVAYTVTVPSIHELKDGVVCYIRNDVVTSTTNFTLNVNGLGAKPVYQNSADATRISTTFSAAVTWLFIYNEKRVEGGCWDAYYGYVNSNTIGYQIRTNSGVLPFATYCGRYRLLFTSADGTKYVPANADSQTSAAKTHTTSTTPIDPFGTIMYYQTTTVKQAGDSPSATILWQQYVITLGYSFNNANAALSLTAKKPVYIKATPNTDGSAVLDYFTQALPSTNDGKIYIFLGIAVDATTVEMQVNHPVYYHNGTGIRRWTGGA